ncbi:hypothetical protein [Streptomyces sp. NPDC018693]|uniref:hypothetical protein n=1 Tax=unclassified Streptomyces TaxID=2593676 RepID=UPI0037AC192C
MEHIIIATENAPARDGIFLAREDLELLAPWLHDALVPLAREDENSDVCQALANLLNLAHRHYGTPASSRSTCICYG